MAFTPKFKDITLSDGRKVMVRTLSGADEMLSLEIVADQVNPKKPMRGMLLQNTVLIVLSVAMIDDAGIKPPSSYGEVAAFTAEFDLNDWNKIRQCYNDLNGGNEDDFLEEPAT